MNAASVIGHRTRSLLFALVWIGLAVIFVVVRLDQWVQFGQAISPLHTIQDKTVILFSLLKRALPVAALLCLLYSLAPLRVKHWVWDGLEMAASWRLTLPAILVMALAIRLFWIYFFPTRPYADSEWYFRNAGELAAGYGFVWDIQSGQPLAAWPIGYPALLALIFLVTGPNVLVAKLLTILISVACVALTYHLAWQMLRRRSVAMLAACFLAGLPGFIVYSSLISTDALFMLLTTLCLVLALRRGEADRNRTVVMGGLCGVVAGATALVRATALALLPMWAVVRWLATGNKRRTAIWLASAAMSMALVMLPWTVRNYMRFGVLIPVSTNGGVNFWIGNNPQAYGGYSFPKNDSNPLFPLIGQELEIDRKGYELGKQFIRQNPQRALELLPAKVFYLYNSNDFGFHWNRLSAVVAGQCGSGPRVFALANLIYVLLVIWAILGLAGLGWYERHNRLWMSGIIFTVYWTVLHLPYFGQDRFALPLLPLLVIYAAYGLELFVRPD